MSEEKKESKEELIEDIKRKNLLNLMKNIKDGREEKVKTIKKKNFNSEKKKKKKTTRRYLYEDEELTQKSTREVLDDLEEDYRSLLAEEGLERKTVSIMFLILGIIFLFAIIFLLAEVRTVIPSQLTVFLLDTFLIIFGMIMYLAPNTIQGAKERELLHQGLTVGEVLEIRKGVTDKFRLMYFKEARNVDDVDLIDIGGSSIKKVFTGIGLGFVIFVGISSMMSLVSMSMVGQEWYAPTGTVVSMSMELNAGLNIFLNMTLVPFGESIFFQGVFPERVLFTLFYKGLVEKGNYNISIMTIRGMSHIISNAIFATLHTFTLIVVLNQDFNVILDSVIYIFVMGILLSAISIYYHVFSAIEVHSLHNLQVLFLSMI